MYSTKWRYEFNRTKSGVVTYGETKPARFEEMKEREWIGSFYSNVEDSIDKTWKKAGMIFSSNFDRRKFDPFFTSSFSSQTCLPSLVYGSELFTFTSSSLAKLERCQLFRSRKTYSKTVRSELY